MVEVFTTNIVDATKATHLIDQLTDVFPNLTLSFDIEYEVVNYPCNHNILRAEGIYVEKERFVFAVRSLGFECAVLEDKTCTK